ncbi:MAG: tRNA (adenosine(37)-N6)-threonylcarbamoyltransferase complex transferase subunit TsaD [Clostridia bacterium]|nr:tRNA (adenosine(37)-N6)-threonylcarbamoyltransferase complex transferase subunit TsaD [Clostridia bacterium]
MYQNIAEEKFNNLVKNHKNKDILILGIESSCDETSMAVVKNGREVLSNVIASQIDIHKRFGGVVPEVASRNHLMAVNNVLTEALEKANVTLKDIDAIAVTYGAGLMGALMVGVTYAKSLAFALDIPLIKVNHIKGHISANYIATPTLEPPFMALVVSGGHTAIVKVADYTSNQLVGSTVDDAIGEAYDKVAKVLGLGYPGGPVIDKTAKEGEADLKFVRSDALKSTYNFSYSGLKTAVINYLHNLEQHGKTPNIPNVCASFQAEAVDVLVEKSIKACKKFKMKTLAVAGGVAANSYLRKELTAAGEKNGIQVLFPPMVLCTDNAAMIGAEGYFSLINGVNLADTELTATPNLHLKYDVLKK